MCFFFSLIPATILAVIGYFVLFASGRAEGRVLTVGKVVGSWLFVLALLPLAGGAYMTLSGKCGEMRGHMRGGMGYHHMNRGDMTGPMKDYHKNGGEMAPGDMTAPTPAPVE